MMVFRYIFITLEVVLLFNLLIGVHELGHFLAGKWRGLKIDRFAIWFGKPIWKKKIGGVEYALGWIPAGGYVALPQMATMEAIEGKSDTPVEQLPPVSPLTLGGGGLGMLWGPTTFDECVATVHAAVDAGINLLDLAPRYGDGKAEEVVGAAFGGRLPDGVRVTSKCNLGEPPAGRIDSILRQSIEASLQRLRLSRLDLFFLHSNVVPDADYMARWPDAKVLAAADLRMTETEDERLSELLDRQQAALLADAERVELTALMARYQDGLLLKAQALREAVRREPANVLWKTALDDALQQAPVELGGLGRPAKARTSGTKY